MIPGLPEIPDWLFNLLVLVFLLGCATILFGLFAGLYWLFTHIKFVP